MPYTVYSTKKYTRDQISNMQDGRSFICQLVSGEWLRVDGRTTTQIAADDPIIQHPEGGYIYPGLFEPDVMKVLWCMYPDQFNEQGMCTGKEQLPPPEGCAQDWRDGLYFDPKSYESHCWISLCFEASEEPIWLERINGHRAEDGEPPLFVVPGMRQIYRDQTDGKYKSRLPEYLAKIKQYK